jgi:aminoglycoside 2'-N-acetyltransferase I
MTASNLTFEILVTGQINQSLREEIATLCTAAHGSDFSRLFSFLPDDGRHVLAYLDRRLVGHVVRTTRWAQIEGLPPFKTAYIDAVTTDSAFQGRGIGSEVMRQIAAVVFAEDYEICALETDRAGFYTRLGWEVWPGPLAGRKDQEWVSTPEAQGFVLILRTPRTPELDLFATLSIEDQGRFW